MSKIQSIHAREVLDSRGNPTVEVEIRCDDNSKGSAIVPSGASTGCHEALELRDNEPRMGGKGVRLAVFNVNRTIGPKLIGRDVTEQSSIDKLLCDLDGTPNKSSLGANAILGVSLACAHAGAAVNRQPLFQYLASITEVAPRMPLPMVNMISGGLHAGGNLDFQDFLLLPIGADSCSEAIEMSIRVYRELGNLLKREGYEGNLVGDEGGYGPHLPSNESAVEFLIRAMEKAGLTPGEDGAIALDVAASHFYESGEYRLNSDGGTSLDSSGMVEKLARWAEKYPILSIEDGLAEDDWAGWHLLTAALGRKVQIIGDDLFATNPNRLQKGIDEKAANSVLVKMNQIGTLTETINVTRMAQRAGFSPVVSARSGETEDSTIADLAVATGAGQIKIGCIVRGERLAKYNQLLRIEEAMGNDAALLKWADMTCRFAI